MPLIIIKSRRFLLVPAHPGGPGKRAVKQLCVCVTVATTTYLTAEPSQLFLLGSSSSSCSRREFLGIRGMGFYGPDVFPVISVKPLKRTQSGQGSSFVHTPLHCWVLMVWALLPLCWLFNVNTPFYHALVDNKIILAYYDHIVRLLAFFCFG